MVAHSLNFVLAGAFTSPYLVQAMEKYFIVVAALNLISNSLKNVYQLFNLYTMCFLASLLLGN